MFGAAAFKRYTVHRKEAVEDSTVLIREGFCIWAFLFGFLWLFYHRAWAPGLLALALAVLLRWLEGSGLVSVLLLAVIQLAIQFWIGSEARDWQREALERRGYDLVDVVLESSEERAEIRYYERHLMVAGGIAQSTTITA